MMRKTNTGVPIYLHIKQMARERIQSGEWKPGALIPGEEALSKDFGCARVTVHRALRELAEEGVLERRRKVGTRVTVPVSRSASFAIPRIDLEIEGTGSVYRYALLHRKIGVPSAAIRGKLESGPKVRALHLRCLHYANEVPYQLEERWINLDPVPEADKESFEEIGPNRWLVERVPWTDAEHVLSAANATAEEAELLEVAENDALFVVGRRTASWVPPPRRHAGRYAVAWNAPQGVFHPTRNLVLAGPRYRSNLVSTGGVILY